MENHDIDPARIKLLNPKPVLDGAYVLYWMQQSQRAVDNDALEYALTLANDRLLPLVVIFFLMMDFPEANLRHFRFMMEGLLETRKALEKRGIQFVTLKGHKAAIDVDPLGRAAAIVVDRGYLRHQIAWRKAVAQKAPCQVVQVECDIVVPVESASPKAEYGARFLRPKLHRLMDRFLAIPKPRKLKNRGNLPFPEGLDLSNPDKLLENEPLDRSVGPVTRFFKGGTDEAKKRFSAFIEDGLARYDQNSNQPQTNDVSHMSPYLHFGQISPVYLALRVSQAAGIPESARAAYLEELVIRRELAINFVYHKPEYDRFYGLPQWARTTLDQHSEDPRPYTYTRRRLESAQTHDPYWNAAAKEMMHTGFMHNYMRMYWAKKILEWSASPEEGFETTLQLNNKYFLDGRDPNSYAGVAWCYGLHDRPWQERQIFGKVRYMAASGLERKCDIRAYVQKVEAMVNAP